MKPVDQAFWLTRLEQQVEGHLQQAIQHYQTMAEVDLNRASASGGWSITQCLAHLNSYGEYYLPRLKQGLAHQDRQPVPATFISSWLGRYLTRLMDPKTGKTKFKAVRQHRPPAGLRAYEVVAQFIDQQQELLRLLQAAETANLNRVKLPLSIAGWLRLPVGDILQFLVAHTERHLQQAIRNR